MTRIRLLATALVACCILAAPAAAQASFTVSTSTTQAGAPAQVTIDASFASNPAGGLLTLHLPAGLVGNPSAFARCTETQFQGDSCPRDSQVGTSSANGLGPLAAGGIYNMAPQGNEPARLGIATNLGILPAAYNEAAVKVRPDGGLDSTIAKLGTTLGQAITSLDLTLDSSFMTLPTSCGPATTVIEAANNDPQQASFTPTGCDAVPFDPTLTATVDRRGPKGARGNPALHTSITLPPGQAAIRTASVALPSRLTLDLPAIKAVCSSDQAAADACPPASAVGAVTAITPLLASPLSGPVNTVQIPGSLFPGLRLSLDGLASLRFTGTLDLTKTITATFDGLPDVPLSNFDLTFVGGGPLKLFGAACAKALRFTAQLTGHNGATVTRTVTATVPGCPATAATALSKGTRPRLRVTLGHGRDAGPLNRAVVTLPKGLTARKGAGRVTLTGDGKRLRSRVVKVTRHRLTLSLPSVQHATLTLGRGVLRGRPKGRFAVRLVRTDGKAYTVRSKPKRL